MKKDSWKNVIFVEKKDGFDTSSAQPGAVNETISSKNQVIMMIFTMKSIGKCNCRFNSDVLIPLNLMAVLL